MRAAIYDRTGPAREVLKVEQVVVPTPLPNEVRVRVATSGVNPSDVKTRSGSRSRTLPYPQIIPHSDGGGVIDEVGANVSKARIGERVWIWNAAWGRAFGSAGEFVVLPSEQAVALPNHVDFDVAACLGIPALTALHAINVDGGVEGKTVLIAGGAGAVGHYAIQFARLLGARRVFATVSSDAKAVLAKSAGAEVVINYKTDDVVASVQKETDGAGVDRIVEVNFGMNIGLDTQVVKRDGDIVVYGSDALEIGVPFVPMILKNIGLRFFIVYNLSSEDRKRAIAQLSAFLDAGKLTHNISARFPLERIAEAHEMVEQGRANGNVVIDLK